MKHTLVLNPVEHRVVLLAMRGYRFNLEGYTKKLFDIAYNKILYTITPELDGMEMIFIVKALRRRANLFMAVRKYAEQDVHLALAKKIDEERQRFQYENGPKIDKAASAGTLTAIV